MIDIFLYGHLRNGFGHHRRWEVGNTAEAIQLLCLNYPEFRQALRVGSYKTIRGELSRERAVMPGDYEMRLGSAPLHIVPVIEGADSSKGILTAVLGVVMIATAFATAGASMAAGGAMFGSGGALATTTVSLGITSMSMGQLALLGGSLLFGGISQLLAPAPEVGSRDAKQGVSYLFDGPVNRTGQGSTLGVIIGDWECAGVRVSGSVEVSPDNGDVDPPKYGISIETTPEGAFVDVSPGQTVLAGESFILIWTVLEPYYEFVSLSIDGTVIPLATSPYTFTPTANTAVVLTAAVAP